nr:hypothetical protein [Tanacetum cinerariifolium]
DTNKLFQKLLEDLQIINEEQAEYINSPSWNRPTFYNDDEKHSVQYKEYLKNYSYAIAAINFNQEKEEPPQNFDIRQLIREECCVKVCEKQKQNREDTMLELLEVCRQKKLYCMHNDVDDLIERALNSKLLSINLRSQRLDKEKQEVKDVVEQPTDVELVLQNRCIILELRREIESDEVNKSSVNNLVPILSEYEVTSDNEIECDVPVCKDSSTFDVLEEHSEILSDSNNDDISIDDVAFEDIEYVEASELVSLEEENSSASFPIFEKSDNSLSYSNNSLPELETFSDHTEETRRDNSIPPGIENIDHDSEGDIYFLEELLVDDSIPLPKNESSNFNHHNDLSFPRPPPKPPHVEVFFDFEPNSGELIAAVMNNIDELNEYKCFDPRGCEIDVFANIEDDDYFPFIFVIRIFYRISSTLRFPLYFSPLGVKTPFFTLASPFRTSGISSGWNFLML